MSIRVEHWSNITTDEMYEFISRLHCRVGESIYEFIFELWSDEQKIIQNINKIARIIANHINTRYPNQRVLITIQFNTSSNINSIAKVLQGNLEAHLALPRNILLDPPVQYVEIADIAYNHLGELREWHEIMFRPQLAPTVQASITFEVLFQDSLTLLPTYRRSNRVVKLFPTQDD